MTASSVASLRKAIRNALIADTAFTGLLGGPRVYDEAPRGTQPPYVTFGDARTRDWSTASDRGAEHFIVLDVWTLQRGERQSLIIAARAQDILHDAPLILDNHRLVNLRFSQVETRRDNQGRFSRASLRFRAVTEAL